MHSSRRGVVRDARGRSTTTRARSSSSRSSRATHGAPQRRADAAGERGRRGGGARRAETVFDATTQYAIIGTDADGLITVFNGGAERMLGTAPRTSSASTGPTCSTTRRSSSSSPASSASRSTACSATARAPPTPTRATGRSCAATASSCRLARHHRDPLRRRNAHGYLGSGATSPPSGRPPANCATPRSASATFDKAPIGKAWSRPRAASRA